MSQFKITGKRPLKGSILISGAKNAALKIIPAAILGNTPSIVKNVPKIADIFKMDEILQSIGAKITFADNTFMVDPTSINSTAPEAKLVKKLRGSVVLIGPLLAKYGKATFSEPGGCLIGSRPIDDHLDLFEQFGVKINYNEKLGKYVFSGKPKAGKIVLKAMSVTATENAMMAAVLSPGITTVHVAAAEPEIADLANFLNDMGAKITGAGTHVITIEGVSSLHGAEHEVLPDRIEAGTYLISAIAANSEVEIGPIIPDHLNLVLKKLEDAGAKFEIIVRDNKSYIKTKKHGELIAQSIDTRPYPGFPTDLQSPYAVLMTQAKGETQIFETIFEGRFRYLEELKLMRAEIEIQNPRTFVLNGSSKLVGTEISSRDIRGGAALVIAALIADGETIINDIEYIDRGYEDMDGKLRAIGAQIERIQD
ncbi:MAG: UDP-N-acetylglucosamine 1-carboxyvinyltransferase [bacterium]